MAEAGIYWSQALERPEWSGDLKQSGFSTVIVWSVHVNPNGDLVINDTPLVTSGRYVASSVWPGQLAALKQGSVKRLIFSVGSGGPVHDFTNIDALIKKYGIGPQNPLHVSFAALKEAIPAIDAIDFDDEDYVDYDVITKFGQLLINLGWLVTFCPYFDCDLWARCLKTLWEYKQDSVVAFNLQCYDGGEGNDPCLWIKAIQEVMPGFPAERLVSPGLWCRNGGECAAGMCPADFTTQLKAWRAECPIQSGWLWRYDDVMACRNSGVCSAPMDARAYASAILSALT
jgi:hypothetical protein